MQSWTVMNEAYGLKSLDHRVNSAGCRGLQDLKRACNRMNEMKRTEWNRRGEVMLTRLPSQTLNRQTESVA